MRLAALAMILLAAGEVGPRPPAMRPRQKLNAVVVMLHDPVNGCAAGIVAAQAGNKLQILTAAHVVRAGNADRTDVSASFALGGESSRQSGLVPVAVIKADDKKDIALVEVTLTDALAAQVGELDLDVVADLGNVPSNAAAVMVGCGQGREWSTALQNQIDNDVTDSPVRFQSTRISPGFSGGALATAQDWRLLAVVQGMEGDVNHGQALNIADALEVLKSWGKPSSLQAPAPVEILTFQAAPARIAKNAEVKLSWSSRGAQRCHIDHDIGLVEAIGQRVVKPSDSISYLLTCTGKHGEAHQMVNIDVTGEQAQLSISAQPDKVLAGQTTQLSWSGTNVKDCTVSSGIGPVEATSGKSVTMNSTTQFTITCRAAGQPVSRSVTVAVLPPAKINRFVAEPQELSPGSSTTLGWDSSGTTSCRIQPDLGSVPTSGSMKVTPTANGTYGLSCAGLAGDVTETVAVKITHPVRILSFTGPFEPVAADSSARFEWATENASSCAFDGNSVETNGSRSVRDSVSTTHVLSCTGFGGPVVSRASNEVRERLSIDSFEAQPDELTHGESASLDWATKGASSCSIDHGVGSVEPTGSVDVRPSVGTTYTLTCRSDSGTKRTKTKRIEVRSAQQFCCDALGVRRCGMVIPGVEGGPCFCQGIWGQGFVCR